MKHHLSKKKKIWHRNFAKYVIHVARHFFSYLPHSYKHYLGMCIALMHRNKMS